MNFSEFPYVEDLKRFSSDIFAKGWGEANGGNISIRLTGEEMVPFETQLSDGEAVKLLCSLPELEFSFVISVDFPKRVWVLSVSTPRVTPSPRCMVTLPGGGRPAN